MDLRIFVNFCKLPVVYTGKVVQSKVVQDNKFVEPVHSWTAAKEKIFFLQHIFIIIITMQSFAPQTAL